MDMISQEEMLHHAIGQGRQAFLITAAGNAPAEELAERLGLQLFCQKKTGCGICPGCKKFSQRNHTDVLRLEGESPISIDQIRQAQHFASIKALEGGFRLLLIPKAHRMNLQAQNCLLKTLEEPPEGLILFLTTAEPEKLLSTIRSRCMVVPVRQKSKSQVRRELEGLVPQERLEEIVALSEGSALQGKMLAGQESLWRMREAVFAIMQRLTEKKNPSVFLMGKQMMEFEKEMAAFLEQMQLFLRDALFYALTGQTDFLYYPRQKEQIRQMASRIAPGGLLQMLLATMERSKRVATVPGLNLKLMAEGLLMQMVEERNLWLM